MWGTQKLHGAPEAVRRYWYTFSKAEDARLSPKSSDRIIY